MAKNESKMNLPKITVDDLFSTQEERDSVNQEKVIDISIRDISDFPEHPFKVLNNTEMEELSNSINDVGVLVPAIVRKKDDGKYEMISGHRRKAAMELNGDLEIDAYIKELNDNEAVIEMVDSNMYREKILPSEKTFAYKMKLDAIKHQGRTSATECPKLSTSLIGEQYGDESSTVKNYIRLTNLIPELLSLVDNTVKYDKRTYITMGMKPAVELSYLNKEEQRLIFNYIEYEEKTPSHAQTKIIRGLSKKKELDFNSLDKLLHQNKGNQNEQISFNKEKILEVVPIEYRSRDKRYLEQYVIEAIVHYQNCKKKNIEEEINIRKLRI